MNPKPRAYVITTFLFLLLTSSSFSTPDSELLISFKNSLPNPSLLPSWAPHLNPCSFSGVTCSSSAGVTAVELAGIPLSASAAALTSSLLLLPTLQTLSLPSTNLTADLSDVALPPSLKLLNFSHNRLSGRFEIRAAADGDDLSYSLETLDLSYNRISSIADVIDLPFLKNLDLAGNGISGEIPSFFNCNQLESLDLSLNDLSGANLKALASCTNLKALNLSSNRLAGELAVDDLSALTALEYLSLTNNTLSGKLPLPLTAMANLKLIELSFNNFSGGIPATLSPNLELLDLSSNALSGSIPGTLCKKKSSLKELYLQGNRLTGSIPASLSNCSMLHSLDLSFNYLDGSIPSSLGSLSRLKDLIMWQNLLEGEIPSELSFVTSLENLILDNNGLTGEIPSGLGNCTNLNWLSLASNRLSGEIPKWIGGLKNLAILKLGNNSFTGEIPEEIGDCRSLVWLDLNSNSLSGRIPGSLAEQSGKIAVGLVTGKRYVYLKNDGSKECHGSGNLLEFAGIRQKELDMLPSRSTCHFTRMYFGSTSYTFNNNGSMIFLDLSNNQLEGEIPKEIGSMFYLMVLNLGHNLLSGLIPSELGKLRSVGVFDLSYNLLQGPIPSSFAGLSLLTELDLSNNKLNGTIPELGQLATFPSDKYANNSGLCGVPLPVCPKHPFVGLSSEHQMSRRREASFIASIAMILLFIVLCIFGVIIFLIENKKRQRSNNTLRDIYIDSRSHSCTASSAWKFTGTKEALSIGLSTFEKPLQKLTFAHLLEATNGFHSDNLVGSGGFGDVYRAQLKDGSVVAIKKLKHISGQGDREFMAEMETIGKIKHRNLVPLLGYCKVGEERLLVYEYMKYGSLEDVLRNRRKAGIKLNWAVRRKIAVGAARGLAFLHHNCIPHIIHRDMKSSNVLLDANLEARVSDFGMARKMSAVDTHLSVSALVGTPGYVPPEYYQSCRCTTKGDVYSYGVVLLELLTGKRPTDSSDFRDNNLVGWVTQNSKIKISDVFDRELLKEDPSLELELLEHLKIACACLDDRPMRRPTMVKVMAMFKEIQAGSSIDSAASGVEIEVLDVHDISLKEGKEDKD